MKRRGTDESAKGGEPPQALPPHLVEELAELLAEALVLDYQGIRGPTVNSPPGFGQTWARRIFAAFRR